VGGGAHAAPVVPGGSGTAGLGLRHVVKFDDLLPDVEVRRKVRLDVLPDAVPIQCAGGDADFTNSAMAPI
jgi:hypothetical protein